MTRSGYDADRLAWQLLIDVVNRVRVGAVAAVSRKRGKQDDHEHKGGVGG